jgi:hypothetical protein
MTIFPAPSLLAYARPTKTKIPIEFLRDRATAGASVPGFVYSLAKSSVAQAEEVVTSLPSATSVRLFSPDIDLLPHAKSPARPVYPFSLTANLPAIDDSSSKVAGWLQEIVTAQIDLGTTAVITPSLPLDATHGETEIRQMLAWADRARRTVGAAQETFLTGLALHRDWLAKPKRRELLLNYLTDRTDSGFYLVVRWSAPAKSDQQLGESDALHGLKEVVEVLVDEDREIVLGRMGLVGWPLLALGASAATVSPIPSHIFRDAVKFARKKGSPTIPRVPLYLDRRLLSYVAFERMTALNTVSGINNCSCADCTTLKNGYEDRAAFRHYLATVAELRDQTVASADPRRFALREVKAARALVSSNPALALPARTTAHLSVWESLLS